jgi:hypothetical protein
LADGILKWWRIDSNCREISLIREPASRIRRPTTVGSISDPSPELL